MPIANQRQPRLIGRAFLVVSFASVAYFLSVGMVLPVLPLFVTGPMAGTSFDVGLVAGVFSISAVILRPLAGSLGDRIGRRVLVLGGGLVAAASIAGYALTSSLPAIVALRLLNGVGEAFFFTGAATAIADLAPESRRGEAVSFFSLAVFVGIGLGPLLGESLLEATSFSTTWIASGAMAGLAVLLALPMPDTKPFRDFEVSRLRLLNSKALLPGTVLALMIWGFAGFSSFVPLFAREIGMAGSRVVFFCYALVIIAIRSVGARIPDVLGARRTAAISAVLSAAGLVLIGGADAGGSLLASVALFAAGQALCFPAVLTLALERASPADRSSVIGTFTAFFDVAFGVGPLTLGVVAELAGIRSVFWASAAVALAGLAVLATAFGRPGSRVGSDLSI